MNTLQTMLDRCRLNRHQTHTFIAFLKAVIRQEAKERGSHPEDEEARLLTALPGQGTRHHLAWHLMHIAMYEEGSFGPSPHHDLWQRYRHGTEPSAPIPTLQEIEGHLRSSRDYFLALAEVWHDGMLDTVPPDPSEGGMTYRQLLESVVWHEAHHVNQCHGNLLRQMAE